MAERKEAGRWQGLRMKREHNGAGREYARRMPGSTATTPSKRSPAPPPARPARAGIRSGGPRGVRSGPAHNLHGQISGRGGDRRYSWGRFRVTRRGGEASPSVPHVRTGSGALAEQGGKFLPPFSVVHVTKNDGGLWKDFGGHSSAVAASIGRGSNVLATFGRGRCPRPQGFAKRLESTQPSLNEQQGSGRPSARP